MVPPGLLPAYKELYADFIGIHAPYELNIPEHMLRDVKQYFSETATAEPTLICFEAISAEVIKVSVLIFNLILRV